MGKVFITKYQQAVNNDSLVPLGAFRFKAKNFQVQSAIGGEKGGVITSKKPFLVSFDFGKTTNTVTTVAINDQQPSIQATIDEQEFDVLNKYELKVIMRNSAINNGGIANIALDIKELKFCNKLVSIVLPSLSNVTGDISNLSEMKDLTRLEIGATSIYGDIKYLANLTKLTYLQLIQTQVTGTLSSLSTLTNLTYISLPSTVIASTDDIKLFTDRGCTVNYSGNEYNSTK